MPTVRFDSFATWYQERADLDYTWAEEGTGRYGQVSHSTKPGDGSQYDYSRLTQFAVFGFRSFGRGGWRRLPCFPAEGPHETSMVLAFKPPVGAIACTEAHLVVRSKTFTGGLTRIYGVALDNFVTRQLDACTGYPVTYRGEFHQHTWGAPRRYRCDSLEYEMPHTSTEVTWDPGTVVNGAWFNTANIAGVVNEIFARPGWKNGNVLALIMAPAFAAALTPPYPLPDLLDTSTSAPSELYGQETADSLPQLSLTY